MMAFGPVRGLAGLDDVSALTKQIPIAVLFFAAALMSVFISTLTVSSWPALATGVALTAAATLLAAFVPRPPLSRFVVLVPAADMLAAGLLRHGTGESQSIYASLVLLPMLWLSAIEGRRYVLYAVLGAVIAILVPFALGAGTEDNPNELLRGFYSVIVFALAAGVVNDLAARARRRLKSAREQTAASEEELHRAAEIQRYLLPTEAALLTGYETAGVCVPSKAVGGDFFDWYEISGGLGFTLGDVMGKGAGAGMIAATTRAVIRSARNSENPATALSLTSDCLTTELSQAASFATLFHARLRAADGRVLFSDAGHGLTLLIRADNTWERLASKELPVGLISDATWHSFEIHLNQGDMIVSFSDGVLDLYDGTLAAIDEIAVLAIAATSAKDLVDVVQKLATTTTNPDDVTIIAVRRTAQQASPDEENESGEVAPVVGGVPELMQCSTSKASTSPPSRRLVAASCCAWKQVRPSPVARTASSSTSGRPDVRLHDIPFFSQPVRLLWAKRIWRCPTSCSYSVHSRPLNGRTSGQTNGTTRRGTCPKD